jgi:hypothetical protein
MVSPGFRRGPSDFEIVTSAFEAETRVQLMRGMSWDQLALLEDGSLDWVYLDAGHDFDSVTRDLAAVLPKLRAGGIIAGHDFVRWGSHGFRGGVVEAVVRFCVREDFGLVGFTFEANYPPSYAIRHLSVAE